MLFSSSLLIVGGSTVAMALLDKTMDDLGFQWVGTTLKILLPLAGFAFGVYFLETNPIVWWLK